MSTSRFPPLIALLMLSMPAAAQMPNQPTPPPPPAGMPSGPSAVAAPSGAASAGAAPTPGTVPATAPGTTTAASPAGGVTPFMPLAPGPVPLSPAVPMQAPASALSQPFPVPSLGTLPAAPPASFAQVTPGATPLLLNADGTVALTVRRNLGAMAVLRDVVAARSGVSSARALTPPNFTIGPAFQTGGTTDGFLFEQPLEINGTRGARTSVASAQLRLAQAQALVQLQSLVYVSRVNFIALARAQQRVVLAQDLLAAAVQFDEIARRQVELGARPGIERIQTRIAVGQARLQVVQAQGEEQSARAGLNAYLGRAAGDPIEAGSGLIFAPTPVDVVQAQRRAVTRGEVAAAGASRDILLAQARLVEAQGRPDIAPEFRISQITPRYMDAGLGVVLTVPLDYGTRRSQVRQFEQSAQAAGDRVTGTQAQARLDVVQAAARLQASQAVLSGYDGELLTDTRALLDSAQAGFQAGGTTIIQVLQAQSVYRTVLADRVDALANAALAQATLDQAIGVIPPAALTELEKDFGKDLLTTETAKQ